MEHISYFESFYNFNEPARKKKVFIIIKKFVYKYIQINMHKYIWINTCEIYTKNIFFLFFLLKRGLIKFYPWQMSDQQMAYNFEFGKKEQNDIVCNKSH